MFGWISRMWTSVSGVVDSTISGWVTDLVNGIYGFLHAIFGFVTDAWKTQWREVANMAGSLDEFGTTINDVVAKLWGFWLPHLVNSIKDAFDKAWSFTKAVYQYALKEIARLGLAIEHAIVDLEAWAIRDIYTPLFKSLVDAWHWITHEGATVFHYISHPADLVDLIWDFLIAKLEAQAWDVAGKLGKFALSLVVHNLKHFVALVEDILNAVF